MNKSRYSLFEKTLKALDEEYQVITSLIITYNLEGAKVSYT